MPMFLRLLAILLACSTALFTTPVHAVDEDDLLPVDTAFALQASRIDEDTVALDWKIADGYYLYRHRISAVPANAGDHAAPIALPKGDAHTDAFFGRVETYRGQVRGTLDQVTTGSGTLVLTVKYQGCADLGVCYPPQTRTLTVAMPASGEAASTAPADGVAGAPTDRFAALGRTLVGGGASAAPAGVAAEALPLEPERAFGFEAIVGDGNTLLLRFTPAKGYYLYRDRSSFRIEGADGISAGRPRWPKGVSHRDEHFGDVVVYFDQVDVPLPLVRKHGDATRLTLVTTFQGCQTDGICYPPMTRRVALSVPAGQVAAAAAPSATQATGVAPAADASAPPPSQLPESGSTTPSDTPAGDAAPTSASTTTASEPALASAAPSAGPAGDEPQSEDQRLAGALSGTNRWLALLGFFGAGLLLAFTPCVLPMIPILSGLIAGQGTRIGARRAFSLSLVYVLASAVVFTIAGVVAGLVGANLQIAFQTPWVLVVFALLFVALSLSMFGLYELQLPARWRARLGALSNGQRGGSWAGVAAMGALSALIVGPCVAPPLAAAVLYIGQTRDPVFGGAALFLLALGMGAPLLAFGVAAGRGLPTSGPWMVAIQRVFGFVFLGLAVWMLSRILPAVATLALYGLLALAFAVWLWSLAHPAQGEGRRWALRFAALVMGLVGTAELFGALSGGHDPLQPLAGLRGGQAAQAKLPFRTIKSLADLEREVAMAQSAGKPLLFDFYADWCVSCKEMEAYTFTRPEVHAALEDFVLLKADVTANDATDQALMKALGIIGPPATLFYVDGAERRALRLFGFEQAEAFAKRARKAAP